VSPFDPKTMQSVLGTVVDPTSTPPVRPVAADSDVVPVARYLISDLCVYLET